MQSEKGLLQETSTIKLLLSVYEQNLTGILYLKKGETSKVLYFNEGKLVWAISNSDKDKLENILINSGYANEIDLNEYKENVDKDNYGKILVENGKITLEELIEVTKLQLKQIIVSVLRWTEGNFQFTKDSPPQKFLSLELNIVGFVSDYIFKGMDIGEIWKEISSLQIVLMQNPDKIDNMYYKLSENQNALLKLFDGKIRLESIISKYSGTPRDTVLKTIYFFLMSGLLIKKETVDNNIFIEDNSNNDEFAQQKIIEKPINIDMEKETSNDEYEFRDSFEEKSFDKKSPTGADIIEKAPFDEYMEKSEKSKYKLTIILSIIIITLAAVGLFVLKNINSDIPKKTEKEKRVEEIFKNNKKPVMKEEKNQKVLEKDIKKSEEDIPVKIHPVNNKTKEKKNINQTKKNKKTALQYYKNGQLSVAMDIWKREIKNEGIKFTILLEVACLKISVKKAFNNIKTKGNFFLLHRRIGRKNCYRVCWGKFISKKDAAEALNILPKYFFKQESPPEVIKIN